MTSPQARQLLDLLDGFEMTKSQHDWLERRFENMTVCQSENEAHGVVRC